MGSRLLLIALAALPNLACLTTKNTKAIENYRSPINEFDRPLVAGKSYRILSGKMAVSQQKVTLQFAEVLIGSNRLLNVESSPAGIRFYESSEPISAAYTAYLIQQNACCLNDDAFRRILFLKTGDRVSAAKILKAHFQYPVAPGPEPSALLVMDFTNIYSFTGMQAYWQEPSEVTFFTQAASTDYAEVMREIAWQERSRLNLAAMYAWYGITVPLDIITSPFQLLGLLAYGNAIAK